MTAIVPASSDDPFTRPDRLMKSPIDIDKAEHPSVWAIGPVPPPVTGLTVLTQKVVERLQEAGPVTFWNNSHGCINVTARAHAKRILRTLSCAGKLLWNRRVLDGRLYLASNSRAGLLLTCILVYVARTMGHRVYLHHHTYGYIHDFNPWMAWINRRMGKCGVHVVHCDQMIRDFRRQYPVNCRFASMFPSVVSIDLGEPRQQASNPFRLGMLSNLTIDKGVDLAIKTFRALHSIGRPVRLELAGPIKSRAAADLIDQALKSYPNVLRHVGPVYGRAKSKFLKDIDVLLFPTHYKDESWGIVINEALAAAAPVITFDRGCTRTVVGEYAGLIVPREGDYVTLAAQQIERWMDCSGEYCAASHAAIHQARYLHEQGEIQLDQLAKEMFSPRNDESSSRRVAVTVEPTD